MVKAFLTNEAGASALEYVFLIAVVGVGMLVAYKSFGGSLNDVYVKLNASVVAKSKENDLSTFTK